jgi:hypothetical protein
MFLLYYFENSGHKRKSECKELMLYIKVMSCKTENFLKCVHERDCVHADVPAHTE